LRIVTPTCVVRPPRPADAHTLAHHADDHAVWRSLRDRFPHPYRLDDAERWIAAARGHDGHPLDFVIDIDGAAVGGIALVPGTDIERVGAEVGYWLGRAHWGRGITTAALRGIVRYAFDVLTLLRVHALPFAHNIASLRVLERAGFVHEGTLRCSAIKEGVILDQALWAALRDDWRSGGDIVIRADHD
jgi:RimJ/RimL family protein N-acetyltransferase